jgi:hypothetical protein
MFYDQATLAEFVAMLPDEAAGCDAVPGPGMTVSPSGSGLLVSGGDPEAPSAGRTGGYSVRVPDDFERAASGKRVRVGVVVESPDGRPVRFRLAYSTNEVGNSGWKDFTVSQSGAGSTFQFDYDVPPMKDGLGDFIGILPIDPVKVWGVAAGVLA